MAKLVAVGNYERAAEQVAAAERVVTDLGGPAMIGGRLLGLGADEMDAGVPWWAWFGVGAIAGGAAVYVLRDRIERVVGGG